MHALLLFTSCTRIAIAYTFQAALCSLDTLTTIADATVSVCRTLLAQLTPLQTPRNFFVSQPRVTGPVLRNSKTASLPPLGVREPVPSIAVSCCGPYQPPLWPRKSDRLGPIPAPHDSDERNPPTKPSDSKPYSPAFAEAIVKDSRIPRGQTIDIRRRLRWSHTRQVNAGREERFALIVMSQFKEDAANPHPRHRARAGKRSPTAVRRLLFDLRLNAECESRTSAVSATTPHHTLLASFSLTRITLSNFPAGFHPHPQRAGIISAAAPILPPGCIPSRGFSGSISEPELVSTASRRNTARIQCPATHPRCQVRSKKTASKKLMRAEEKIPHGSQTNAFDVDFLNSSDSRGRIKAKHDHQRPSKIR